MLNMMNKKSKMSAKKHAPLRKKTVKRVPIQMSYQRIVYMGTIAVALLLTVLITPARHILSNSVLGAATMAAPQLFNQTIIAVPHISGAVRYELYYKTASDTVYKHAYRNISSNATTVTVSYLKKNTTYVYRFSAVNAANAEFWWSAETPMVNLQSM